MSVKRILITDDEHLACLTLADFLEEAGYQAAMAGDGETAIRLHTERPFDLCIVDIRMPGMNGVDTIMALHQIAPVCHFIVYTGSPQFTLPIALIDIGLDYPHIVAKPVRDMSIFLDLIDSLSGEASDESGGGNHG